jgi:hypothetical protein
VERQIIVTDWRAGVSRSAYVDCGPGRAEVQHGALTRKLGDGSFMSNGAGANPDVDSHAVRREAA